MKWLKLSVALAAVLIIALGLAACGGSSDDNSPQRNTASQEAEKNRENFAPFIPHNEVEGKNYNRSQQLYDNPNTILYCTVLPNNPTIKPITVPIAGKLTSSSVSAFPSQEIHYDEWGNSVTEKASVDGLYHGSPPAYRYGFTPGDQFVELWSGDEGFCTTSPTEIQQETLNLTISGNVDSATAQAEKALAEGNGQKASKILKEGVAK